MPSILQQQLQQVSTTWAAAANKRQRGKPSLLYTAQEAADVDLQSIYDLAQEGLEQLCAVDTRFEPFQDSLFSQTGIAVNRDQQTKAEIEVLDASLSTYLRLLTDHFLSAAAFQTLEYLIRKYRINEYNVHQTVACGLPYHATNHFVRLVQVLHLKNTCWQFLSPMQKSGAAVPRALLVQRCINDQAVLRAICASAEAAGIVKSASSSMQSFYAVLVCELLLASQPVKEGLARLLLPFLMAGLGPDVTTDYRAATMMILTQLASQATLSDSLLTGLLQKMLQNIPATQISQAVMVLCQVALLQPQLKQLPKALFKIIIKVPDLVDQLQILVDRGLAVGPLLALLLPPLADNLLHKKVYIKRALQIIKKLPLGAHAQTFALTLLGKLPQADEEEQAALQPVVRALDLASPKQMDAAVNKLLQHSKGSSAEQAAAQKVVQLMQEALGGSAQAPLPGGGSTLALALDAPSAEMRILALQQLSAGHQADAASSDKVSDKTAAEDSAFLHNALLRRLADQDPTVVHAALCLPVLLQVPSSALYTALSAVMAQYTEVVNTQGRKDEHKRWRAVAKMVLKLLTPDLTAKLPVQQQQQALLQLLNNSLAIGNSHKVALQATHMLQAYPDPLLSGLSAVKGTDEAGNDKAASREPSAQSPDSSNADELAPTTPNRPTASSRAADAAHNQAVIAALASQLTATDASHSTAALQQAEQLIVAAANFPHARRLLLLALMHGCCTFSKPSAIAVTILRVMSALWEDVRSSAAVTGNSPAAVMDQHGFVASGHWKQCGKKPAKAHASALQQALLLSLASITRQDLQALTGKLAPASLVAELLQLEPEAAYHPHCCALLDKAASPALLLSDIFGAPDGSAAVKGHALRLLQPYPTAQNAASVPAVLLPRLFAAAASTSQQMRAHALDCLVRAAGNSSLAAHLASSDQLPPAALQGFLSALAQHHAEILSDGQGFLQVVKQLLPQIGSKSRPGQLDSKVASSLITYLLHILPELHHDSSILAASLLIRMLSGSATPSHQLQSAITTLQHLPVTSQAQASASLAQIQLACELLQLFTAEAFSALPSPKGRGKAAKTGGGALIEGLGVLLDLLKAGVDAPQAEREQLVKLRLAAFQQLGAELYAVMPVQQQMQAFLALLNGSARDSSEEVRKAARSALAELPLTALSLMPLLAVTDKAAVAAVDLPAPKTRRRSKAESSVKQAAAGLHVLELAGEATELELCTSVLELLQWKEDIQDEAQLLPPLTQLLQQLLALTVHKESQPQATAPAAMDMSDDGEEASDEEHLVPAPDGAASRSSSQQGYSMALALQALENIAQRAAASWLQGVDLYLVISCARQAPDAAVRNAALALLEVMARKQPDTALKHVLEVVAVIGSTATQQDDMQSHQVAAATLAAVVPAWLQAGKPLPQLAAAVAAPLPDMLPHRRLPLLTALVAAVPQDAARPAVLSLLLHKALQLHKEAAAEDLDTEDLDTEDLDTEDLDTEDLDTADLDTADLDTADLETEIGPSITGQTNSWPIVLAHAVCLQGSMLQQIQALTQLLQQTVSEAGQQPFRSLPTLAVSFSASHVKESASGLSASRSSEKVQEAYSALLEQALSQLQLLGEVFAQESNRGKYKENHKAQEGLYGLLEALAKVMHGGAYVAALLQLTEHSSEAVVRRALKLLTTRISSLDLQNQGDQALQPDRAGAEGLVDAALQLCSVAPALLATGEDTRQLRGSTRQAALVALSALAHPLGPTHPQPFLQVLPAVVTAAKAEHRSVRSSALATAAACLSALGSQALPLLPKLVPAVLAAAQTAVEALAAQRQAGIRLGEDTSIELEAASALAAVGAFVDGLKAFLSPHLPALLQLLFSPAVLNCTQANISQSASIIRIQLAGFMPPRLLLAPLFGHFEGAVQEGEAATVSLLAMAQRTIEQMDALTAAQHADTCFTFLTKALDLRQRRPASLTAALGPVEQGSAAVLLAFTLKLSEAKFKPLFLRLLEWASSPPAAQPDAKPLGRQVALFTAVLGLADRLRSVFVPYFRYLLDPIAAHLGGTSPNEEGHRRKKKKKSSTAVVAVADETSDEPAVVEDTWQLRYKVVQSLHSCFLYDTVSFLDEAAFHRLLPLLVTQLAAQPPTSFATLLVQQQAYNAATEANAQSADPFGDATVSALVQMAITVNNDALWKSLNHQTLMATRSAAARERLRAIAAVEGLVERMREEYLLLLAEALPFLAELLEDPEHTVVSATQRLIKRLEDLSGESLQQYLQV